MQCTATAGIGAGMVIHSYQSSQTKLDAAHINGGIGSTRYYIESGVNFVAAIPVAGDYVSYGKLAVDVYKAVYEQWF